VAYPTLCQERKGWGTRLFVVLPAVSNTNRGLIEELFLFRKVELYPEGRMSLLAQKQRGPDGWRNTHHSVPATEAKENQEKACM
jgi:hypothetical protein